MKERREAELLGDAMLRVGEALGLQISYLLTPMNLPKRLMLFAAPDHQMSSIWFWIWRSELQTHRAFNCKGGCKTALPGENSWRWLRRKTATPVLWRE